MEWWEYAIPLVVVFWLGAMVGLFFGGLLAAAKRGDAVRPDREVYSLPKDLQQVQDIKLAHGRSFYSRAAGAAYLGEKGARIEYPKPNPN